MLPNDGIDFVSQEPMRGTEKHENRFEPIAIVFTANSLQAVTLKRKCRFLLKQINVSNVCVSNASNLMQTKRVDILVISVFRIKSLLSHVPGILKSNRLKFIYFHCLNEMVQTNEQITRFAVDTFMSRDCSTQVSQMFVVNNFELSF